MALDPKHLQGLEPELAQVLSCVATVVGDISAILRSAGSDYSGSTNAFGDEQLEVDVQVDRLIFERLASCSAVQGAGSEEQPEIRSLPGSGYTVVFDPLDGSSIMSANFAVGTIFGIWPGGSPVGRAGRHQAAAAYAVYGPQTILVWAKPRAGGLTPGAAHRAAANGDAPGEAAAAVNGNGNSANGNGSSHMCRSSGEIHASHEVQEYILQADGTWRLQRSELGIGPVSRTFAPANLRAAGANAEYAALVRRWIEAAFTLRYTGGMVPDVHHILAKGSGVFCNPCSEAAPAKLRLLFECAPLALIVEAAGGSSTTGQCSVLDVVVRTPNDRSKICLGSSQLVEDSLAAMQAA
ncbi:hypothetical protein PLESTB_000368200 [Pleodorina starrii]|uniref:Fructose-bisphosphatase n=1 Tax=Pleodorina starrii TaxID=330485 RepID=A0A9W6EYT7_9CHLO|nr:hypothetical protein PLESTM_000026700 [Pleodorina starrii]GLC50338.1 hypothetical protein PLESTB_000368200 [Pleodorina starrii]GLC64279.1 hypothetical protein PLESTF_000144500 [Pleodorina starrii]